MAGSVRKKIQMAGVLGRVGLHMLGEKIRRPRPRSLSEVPPSVAALTPEWLTAALCKDHPGAQVRSMSLGVGSDGSSTRRVLHLEYNDAGREAGLPPSVFTKSTPKFKSRAVTLPIGALLAEALFYDVVRPGLDIESPLGNHMAVDLRSGRSMYLMEDVVASKGATFGDPTEVYIDRPKAEDMVVGLAALHGHMWESPLFRTELAEIRGALQFQLDANDFIDFEGRSMIGVTRAESVIPAEVLKRRAELWPAVMRSLELHEKAPNTLLHSDVHSRNWYVTADGRMGMFDWAAMTRGIWSLDVAYAISSALTVEDRRAWERDLIALYVDRLAANGGPSLTFDEAWLGYRQQVFHGLGFWLFTIGAGKLQPAMQPESVSLINLERMTNMIADLDCIDSLPR